MSRQRELSLRGKRVIVLGLGVHGGGLGVTRFLVEQGAQVTVTDLKRAEQLQPSLEALKGLPVRYVLGEHRLEDLADADLLVRNPAVPAESPYLAAARAAGVRIEMEMGLFVERCPAPLIGVTGTKGKTTTTLLIGSIVRQVHPSPVVAGNLRVSALELLPVITPNTPVVLELSSWQLEGLEPHQYSPHVGVITNISADHLNRYASYQAYAQAKATIIRWQDEGDWAVLNADNAVVAALANQTRGQVVWFSRTQAVEGVYCTGPDVVWRRQGHEEVLCGRSDVRLPGVHNLENVLAACAAARAWGVAPDKIRQGIRAFGGTEHRLELVATIDGVDYINDTTATAPAAALAALQSFDRPMVLIAGGADKSLDFTELGAAIVRRVKAVVLLEGTATDKLENAIRQAGGGALVAGRYDDLRRAVERARELVAEGDVVLLSPACASFGLFANEFERGDMYKRIVRSLGGE